MIPAPEGPRKEFFSGGQDGPSGGTGRKPSPFFAGMRLRILALVLLALVPALGLMLHLAREHRTQITQDVNQNALRLSRFLAASLERDVQAARIFLSALSHQSLPQGPDPSQCPEFLNHLDIKAEIYDA